MVFAAGLMLIVGVLGYLVYDGATLRGTPPVVEVSVGPAQQQAEQFVVPVVVTNTGDQTAEGVLVQVTLVHAGEEPEQAEFEIAFLPRHSTREGWVSFETDPSAAGELTARVVGYENP